MRHAAHNFAATCGDKLRGRGCHGLAPSVVHRDDEPLFLALLQHAFDRCIGHGIGVVGVVHQGRTTVLIGQRCRHRTGVHDHLVALASQAVDGDRNGGVVHVNDQVNALVVEPLARLGGAYIRLVLVVCRHQLDLLAQHRATKVGNRHARRFYRTLTRTIGIQARHVAEHRNLDRFI